MFPFSSYSNVGVGPKSANGPLPPPPCCVPPTCAASWTPARCDSRRQTAALGIARNLVDRTRHSGGPSQGRGSAGATRLLCDLRSWRESTVEGRFLFNIEHGFPRFHVGYGVERKPPPERMAMDARMANAKRMITPCTATIDGVKGCMSEWFHGTLASHAAGHRRYCEWSLSNSCLRASFPALLAAAIV